MPCLVPKHYEASCIGFKGLVRMTSLLSHFPKGTRGWLPSISTTSFDHVPCLIVLFIEKGVGQCQVGQQIIQVSTDYFLLISPNETCDLSGLEATEKWILNFSIEALTLAQLDVRDFSILLNEEPPFSFLDSRLSQYKLADRRFRVSCEDRLCWSICLHQLKQELSEQSFGYAEIAHSLLKLLTFDILRLFRFRSEANLAHSLVSDVIRYIEDNYQKPISLCDVAAAMDRSPAYLTDRVRRETGKTVLAWIFEYRMSHARQLLLHTDYSVSKIAEQVGYFDRRHFSRQFLRSHGMPPKQWRGLHDGHGTHPEQPLHHTPPISESDAEDTDAA